MTPVTWCNIDPGTRMPTRRRAPRVFTDSMRVTTNGYRATRPEPEVLDAPPIETDNVISSPRMRDTGPQAPSRTSSPGGLRTPTNPRPPAANTTTLPEQGASQPEGPGPFHKGSFRQEAD